MGKIKMSQSQSCLATNTTPMIGNSLAASGEKTRVFYLALMIRRAAGV